MNGESGTALQKELVETIRREGPIPFVRFMELALYHPVHGFYTRGGGPWGHGRGYVTSIDAGPVFASLLMPLFRGFWESLGRPGEYLLVDAGGGDGRFADNVATEAAQDPSPFATAFCSRLHDRTLAGGSEFPPSPGPLGPCCIFANELLDALPVHLVRRSGGRLEEALVAEASGSLTLSWDTPTSGDLPVYFDRLALNLHEGQQAAVNLEAERWIRRAAAGIEAGHLVIVDYGYPAPLLFSPELAAEPIRTYCDGREGGPPLAEPGRQDITSMIDFTSVARWAEEAGFKVLCLTDQYRLLQRSAERLAEDPEAWARLTGGGGRERLQRGMALRALLSPEGISGSFRVLVASRGAVGPVPLLDGLKMPSGFELRIE